MSLKKIAKEISDEGELTSEDTLKDIQMLWIGAAQQSETVKFIVYKLSNPDEDKPKESIVKKIIQPISTVGSLAGIGIGNPLRQFLLLWVAVCSAPCLLTTKI